ncbi:type III secretion system effector E3 ubiquitin ligase (YopM/NopM family) [Herbaspirillum sp. SJZ099]|nr:type III secretion system effector E3 ubiquitin ligase (YopM/NopM family) [Herbaspirillum sp. SJZ099]
MLETGAHTSQILGAAVDISTELQEQMGGDGDALYPYFLHVWEKVAPPGDDTRKEVRDQFLHMNKGTLDLSAIPLHSLPLMPDHCTSLTLIWDQLDELPPFPKHLTNLDLIAPHLTVLPAFPASLDSIKVNSDLVREFPAWPGRLRKLEVFSLKATKLPDLPVSLESLEVLCMRLTELPALPRRLEALTVSSQGLTELPALPKDLKKLQVWFNPRLTGLPTLPKNLQLLDVAGNMLTSWPTEWPASLRLLDVSNNQLTSFPENIYSLPPTCQVDITGNPGLAGDLPGIRERISAAGYNGPRILFDMSEDDNNSPARPLHEAVEEWLGSEDEAQAERWRELDAEPAAGKFSLFLDRLWESVNYTPKLKAAVATWLPKIAQDSELRALIYAIADRSTESCEDRVALTYNDMKNLDNAYEVSRGAYDTKLDALVELGRGAFRLDALAKIASRKVESLRQMKEEEVKVDEIVVYLAYQVRLHERLGLPTDLVDMRFFNVSGVTQQDLDDAVTEVQSREQAEFFQYFLLDWAPWQAMLTRFSPGWREREHQMLTTLQPAFKQEVKAKLAEVGLSEDDDDALAQLGSAAMKEQELEVRYNVAREVLRARGEEAFLDRILEPIS